VEERLQKRLSSWKEILLSHGGKLVLINSVHMYDFFLPTSKRSLAISGLFSTQVVFARG
jgi:hypothetical protein